MKKRWLSLLLVLALLLLQVQTVLATSSGPSLSEGASTPTFDEGQTDILGTNATEKDVEFVGQVSTVNVISVIVPTRVTFLVNKTATGWNKIASPDFRVQNLSSNTPLKVSIAGSEISSKSAGVSFVSVSDSGFYGGDIPFGYGSREVALAVAPKATYGTWGSASNYALQANGTYDYHYGGYYYPRTLTSSLAAGSTAIYNVYGDVSSGFGNGETFFITVKFKVEIV